MSAAALGPNSLKTSKYRIVIHTENTKAESGAPKYMLFNTAPKCAAASPLQYKRGVGLAVVWVVDMNRVSTVCSELTQSSLAASQTLCQTTAGASYS